MKTIGMIVAVELQSVLKRYGAKLVKRKETAGYQVLEYETDQYRMVIVNCGPGEIAADHTEVGRYSQYPDIFLPTTKVLSDTARKIHPELVPVVCASGDKFIADPEQKIRVHEMFSADICEMEAAGIVLTCNRNQVPCMLVKCVSDGIEGGFEEFQETMDAAADLCLEVVEKIVAGMEISKR